MVSDTITINRDDLYNLIREAVRDELNEIQTISDSEQAELDVLYGKKNPNSKINFDECIKL